MQRRERLLILGLENIAILGALVIVLAFSDAGSSISGGVVAGVFVEGAL